MAISGLTNTLPRSSCGKCVQVLKELLSGLDDDDNGKNNNGKNKNNNNNNQHKQQEPPPLTLLRAIARSSRDHPWHDRWGQELPRNRFGARTNNNDSSSTTTTTTTTPKKMLHIEETEDGVKLTIPVETTAPDRMKEWKHLEQMQDNTNNNSSSSLDATIPNVALATSVRTDDDDEIDIDDTDNSKIRIRNPLTIELKCRQCETTGPEAGARAFLMGPEPLSIVLCHNRIHSEAQEIQEILTHELIHLYDVQTLKLDLSDCETVAYSEVRAAREAECHVMNEALQDTAGSPKGVFSELTSTLEKHVYKPYCVRSIALGATRNMFPSRGTACLNKVWETAYKDHRPFVRENHIAETKPTTRTKSRQQEHDHNNDNQNNDSGTIHGTSGK